MKEKNINSGFFKGLIHVKMENLQMVTNNVKNNTNNHHRLVMDFVCLICSHSIISYFLENFLIKPKSIKYIYIRGLLTVCYEWKI